MRLSTLAICVALAASATACKKTDESFTRAEAQSALTATQESNAAFAVTDGVVEITTGFTLGDAVDRAAENMRDFVRSQVPCATAALSDDQVLGIDFGARGAGCTWRGRTYTGRVEVQVDRVEDGIIEITHSWFDLSDGAVTVNGGATVTWDRAAVTRRVQHELAWESARGTGSASGDRTQQPLEGGGLQIDGSRNWTGVEGGTWTLSIDGVEARRLDPVPQAGSYALTSPAGKALSMTFARLDATTIEVTIAAGERRFSFNVKGLPADAS